jgi:YfiH family protein
VITVPLPGAHVVFTDRWGGPSGGVSRSSYASANLALHVGDREEDVVVNRARLVTFLAASLPDVPADPRRWRYLDQVHGAAVVVADGLAAPGSPPTADAAVTSRAALPLVVMTADCAPIALVAPGAVGVVHAGWAGLERGVIGHAVAGLRELASGPVHAVLGPCIHPARYPFGRELLDRLVARFGTGVEGRTADGAPAFDLPAAVRIALRDAGVDRIDDVGVCTAASPDYFSYRRDGATGRQAVVVVAT